MKMMRAQGILVKFYILKTVVILDSWCYYQFLFPRKKKKKRKANKKKESATMNSFGSVLNISKFKQADKFLIGYRCR